MVYRMVIVDDESYIADATAMRLGNDCTWDMEIQVFYTAQDALECMRQQKTDLLIADICMPGMNGLELMNEVSTLWPRCQIILLTAHDRFDYVYQAIRQSQVDYVLKGDGYETLRSAVERAVERLNTTVMREEMLNNAIQQTRSALPWLQREFMLDLVHAVPYSADTVAQSGQRLNMSVDVLRRAYLLLAYLHDSRHEPLFARMERMGVLSTIAQEFMPEGAQLMSLPLDEHRLLWLCQFAEDQPAARLEGMLEGIQEAASSQFDLSTSFAWAPQPVDYTGYPAAYNRLTGLVSRQAMGQERMWILCAGQTQSTADELLKQQLTQVSRWSRTYRAGETNFDELYVLFDQLSAMESVQDMKFRRLYLQISMQLAKIMQDLELPPEQLADLAPEKLYDAGAHASTADAASYLRFVTERLLAGSKENAADSTRALISHVKTYIKQHLNEDISLARLADYVHVNASYLSRVFKEQTDQKMVDYIREKRISKACELLRRPELHIQEVGEWLGFQNPAYFSYFFKKHMGQTPSEYRDANV